MAKWVRDKIKCKMIWVSEVSRESQTNMLMLQFLFLTIYSFFLLFFIVEVNSNTLHKIHSSPFTSSLDKQTLQDDIYTIMS